MYGVKKSLVLTSAGAFPDDQLGAKQKFADRDMIDQAVQQGESAASEVLTVLTDCGKRRSQICTERQVVKAYDTDIFRNAKAPFCNFGYGPGSDQVAGAYNGSCAVVNKFWNMVFGTVWHVVPVFEQSGIDFQI